MKGTGGQEEPGLPVRPEEPALPEEPGVVEDTGRIVVEPRTGKDLVGMGKGTGLDQWLEP